MTATDHPHTNPGDGRPQCPTCGKWVWPVIHSCKGVRVAPDASRPVTAQPKPTAAWHGTDDLRCRWNWHTWYEVRRVGDIGLTITWRRCYRCGTERATR